MDKLVMIDKNFWEKRRVLLTGHTGFKGSWFINWLSELGADICGYSLEPYKESLFNYFFEQTIPFISSKMLNLSVGRFTFDNWINKWS